MRLNLDAGELPDESPVLWAQFDILNIACGGHAGDTESMTRLVRFCIAHDIDIGAHPSYPDREQFGRRTLAIIHRALYASLGAQCGVLEKIARDHHATVKYVKPHGALYHDASRDPALAAIVIDAVVLTLGSHVTVIGPRGHLQTAATSRGLGFAVEGFADRRMRPDGSLVPRSEPDALITSPALAVAQALSLTNVDTICVHADTPGSLEIAHAVRTAIDARATRKSDGSSTEARTTPRIKSDGSSADAGASTTARIKSDGSSADAGASTAAGIKSDGSSADAGASTTARIKSDGSSTEARTTPRIKSDGSSADAGASTTARIKSDGSSADAGASTAARIKSDGSSADAGASTTAGIKSDGSSADAGASTTARIKSDGSSTGASITARIKSDGSSTEASTTPRIKSDGSSADAGASITARIKSDGSSADAGASTTAGIKSDGSSADAGASTTARIKSDGSSTGASTTARIKSDGSSADAGASTTAGIESDGSSTGASTTARIKSPTWVALGDRAIRFARPRSTSARALVAAIKRWPGVVDVVVARHDVAAYFDAPFTRAPFASTDIDVDHRTRAPFMSTNLDVDHRTPFVSTNLDVDHRTPFVSTNLDVDYRIAELADVRDLDVPVREHELRAIYDGIDLEDVARATGLTVDEVVSAHVGTTYDVDTLGFAPGFAYLVGLDPLLHVPRRTTPRTRVPAGALAIAGEYTAVYPFVSPGGWNLIGRVDQKMFDAKSGARLQLGDRVRFVR